MPRPLLLLHGALYSKREFAPLTEAIGASHTVITVDFAGHGGRDFPDVPFSIEFFAREVLDLLNDRGIDAVDVFGYSMGGYVALYLAAKEPGRLHSIVTLGTKLRWDRETGEREASMLHPEKILQKVPAFAETLARRHGEERWREVVDRTRAMLLALGERPALTVEEVTAISIPVRLMVGDCDSMVSIDETVEYYRALPSGQLAVLPNTQHPLEKVDLDDIVRAIDAVATR